MIPATPVNCNQYTPGIIDMQKQENALIHEANRTNKHGTLMMIITKYRHINKLLGFQIQDQQDCYILNGESRKTDKQWAHYHPNGWPGRHGGW